MPILYDFYQNPLPKEVNREPLLHARVVTRKTVSTKQIAKEVEDLCSLSSADIVSALSILSDVLVRSLTDSNCVHLKGLGYFRLSLSCDPVQTPHEIRAESIRVKNVVFRPEKELKNRLRNAEIKRIGEKSHSAGKSDEEIKASLGRYFDKHTTITRRDFQALCGFTPATASRRLRVLLKEGFLNRIGHKNAPLYTLNE